MSRDVRVKLDRSVLEAILKGNAEGIDTRGMIRGATERVRDAAGEGHGMDLSTGRQRLNGRVWTVTNHAKARQRKNGNLLKALQGGKV